MDILTEIPSTIGTASCRRHASSAAQWPSNTTVPGERSLLRPGEYVFLIAQTGTNDKMTALRIQVSKDGVKPAL